MPQDQKFEIPQELRQLAEENVERSAPALRSVHGWCRANYGRLVIRFIGRSCPRIPRSPRARCETCKRERRCRFQVGEGRGSGQRPPRIDRPADAIRAIPDELVCRADAGVWAPDDEGLRRDGGPKLVRGTAASATICRGMQFGNDRPQSHLLPLMPISGPKGN